MTGNEEGEVRPGGIVGNGHCSFSLKDGSIQFLTQLNFTWNNPQDSSTSATIYCMFLIVIRTAVAQRKGI